MRKQRQNLAIENSIDRYIHPVEVVLFLAAALRGMRLEYSRDGLYRVVLCKGATAETLLELASFKDVAKLCGAFGNITFREAAERDGLVWPRSAEAFLAAMKNI